VKLRGSGSAWLVTRHEDAIQILGNPRFAKDPRKAKGKGGSTPPWLPGPLRALSRNMLDLDQPDHRRLRNLVQKAFTPRVIEELSPRIERITSRLLDAIEHGRTGRADLIGHYAAPTLAESSFRPNRFASCDGGEDSCCEPWSHCRCRYQRVHAILKMDQQSFPRLSPQATSSITDGHPRGSRFRFYRNPFAAAAGRGSFGRSVAARARYPSASIFLPRTACT